MESNKELEALEFIKLDYGVEPQGYELIKSALERKEKLEKAWEIVKNHGIDMSFCSWINERTYEQYLKDKEGYIEKQLEVKSLTETEFNLLKEMLEEK